MANHDPITPSEMHGVMHSGNSVEQSSYDWLASSVAPESTVQSTALGLVRHLDPPSAALGVKRVSQSQRERERLPLLHWSGSMPAGPERVWIWGSLGSKLSRCMYTCTLGWCADQLSDIKYYLRRMIEQWNSEFRIQSKSFLIL